MAEHPIFVGCAGWSIPRQHADRFPAEGSHLERYAGTLPAVEINSSFYRSHQPATYARWGASVPDGFRFAVKVPKTVTHLRWLADSTELIEQFLCEVRELGDRLGPLLVQLPPSCPFQADRVESFFGMLRDRFAGGIVCEPRHPTWFREKPERMLVRFEIARAGVDPGMAQPGGWDRLIYHRLHGSPDMYYSDYEPERLATIAENVRRDAERAPVWCIFDNTALGHATANACDVWKELYSESRMGARL